MTVKIENIIRIAVLLVLVLFLIPFMSSCLADPTTPLYNSGDEKVNDLSNTITVTGRGSEKVAPDKAMVNISVFIEEDTSQDAVDRNSTTTADVIEALENLEIEDLEIKTISFNLDPLYDYRRENEPPEVYAYRATTVMEVSTRDMTVIGEIISSSITAGANDVSSLRFGLSDELEREAKKNALREASQDGKNKAEDIADSLGLEIVDVYYISESETYVPVPFVEREFAVEESLESVASVPVSPNEVEVTATVQISFIFR